MAEPGFVHLHVHSSYSLLEGALTIARLAELAKADRQPALALTDTDNMFGALEFSEKIAGAGIQPIVGCALAVDFADQETGPRGVNISPPQRPRIVLLAARENGYRSLLRLNSRAFLEPPQTSSRTSSLPGSKARPTGSLRLTGGPGGPLDAAVLAGQGSLADASVRSACAAFRRPALYRAAAPRHERRTHSRARPDRAGLCARHSARCQPTSRYSPAAKTTRRMMP